MTQPTPVAHLNRDELEGELERHQETASVLAGALARCLGQVAPDHERIRGNLCSCGTIPCETLLVLDEARRALRKINPALRSAPPRDRAGA